MKGTPLSWTDRRKLRIAINTYSYTPHKPEQVILGRVSTAQLGLEDPEGGAGGNLCGSQHPLTAHTHTYRRALHDL